MTLFDLEDKDKPKYKYCNHCGTWKPVSVFPRRLGLSRDMLDSRCTPCKSKHMREARQGKKNCVLKKQDHCMLCGCKSEKIVFDHDHKTGKFRGWLCERCNFALGYMRDDIELLKKSIQYLQGEILNDYIQRDTSLLALYKTAFRER